MAKIGYARVSTISQSLETQINLLKAEGCIKIFSEKVSGKKTNRSKLDECLKYLREDDVLVVTKIDRLGRTTKQLINLASWLQEHNIELKILDGNFNMNSPLGKMIFTVMSGFAELETDLNRERTLEGLNEAKARGRNGGRPGVTEDVKNYVMYLYNNTELSGNEIAKKTGVSRSTVYRIKRDFN
ncbi:MAG: recombinase family protein [Staphylococcus warneri]|nr:recombinase family protein [Staphylococcus epidermidis]MDU2137114.1 recombinase family protein [Staphylococcus warneri]MDU4504113.1 recombinase family protein [Staphylococcus warneri]MDU5112794.1 recombinase family protein [Staphylococcus epidermidis]HDF5340484.1 recombinase family protein [Staphylococcus aureus]